MGGIHVALGLVGLVTVEEPTELDAPTVLLMLLGLAFFPVFITTVVLYCRWFHLAVRHAVAQGATVAATPASAVGSWFIPFVNLVKPFNITRQLIGGTGGDPKGVTLWQVLWFGGNLTSNLGTRLDMDGLTLVSALLLLGAAFTGVGVINELTRSAERPLPTARAVPATVPERSAG